MEETEKITAEEISQRYMNSNLSYDLPQDDGDDLETVEGELPEAEDYKEEEE